MRPNEFKLRQKEAFNNSLTTEKKREIKRLLLEDVSRKFLCIAFSVPYKQLTAIKNDKLL